MKTKILFIALAAFILNAAPAWAKDLRTAVFKVEQLDCANCAKKVQNNIKFEKGVKTFSTDLPTKTVTITYDAEKTNINKLIAGFKKFKYEAVLLKEAKEEVKK